jgi:YD repeat-containing protein
MPTFTETLVPTVSLSGGGGGGDAAQWGPCPPGSLMEAQELGLDLRAPSAVLPATDECARGTPPGGCSSGGCGCAKCPSGDDAPRSPVRAWLSSGPARVNPANGNLVLALGVPAGGPVSPEACSYYNGLSTDADNFGYGWGHAPRRWLEEPSGTTADLHQGGGTVLRYTGYNGITGLYTPPAGATSKLRKTMSIPVKWTETRGDGSQYEYDAAGHCHSYTYDAASRVTCYENPRGERTSFSYQSGHKRNRDLLLSGPLLRGAAGEIPWQGSDWR